jgi:NAD-dependent deacetylase
MANGDKHHVQDRAALPQALVDALRTARSIAVLTGAGVSAESGVPTFRDALTGLWAKFDPRELATPGAFARNPRRVWDWYAMRRAMVASVQPNAAHRALVTLEERAPEFVLLTQNVDGLHQRAGSREVVELHGNITRVRCSRDGTIATQWDDTDDSEPPRCAACGAFLRPDVVWFEELLPAGALERAEHAMTRCDALLVVGTSAEVYPAAALPEPVLRRGGLVIEINAGDTPLTSSATYALRGAAGILLPALVAALG